MKTVFLTLGWFLFSALCAFGTYASIKMEDWLMAVLIPLAFGFNAGILIGMMLEQMIVKEPEEEEDSVNE